MNVCYALHGSTIFSGGEEDLGDVKWVHVDIDSDAEKVDDLDGSVVSIIVNESFSVRHTSHRIGGNQKRS